MFAKKIIFPHRGSSIYHIIGLYKYGKPKNIKESQNEYKKQTILKM